MAMPPHVLSLGYDGGALNFVDEETVAHVAGNGLLFRSVLTGSQSHHFAALGRGIGAVATLPGGAGGGRSTLLAYAEKGLAPTIHVLAYPSLAPRASLLEPSGELSAITHLAFSADGTRLASLGGPPRFRVTLWDWDAGVALASLTLADDTAGRGLSFHPTDASTFLAFGTRGGALLRHRVELGSHVMHAEKVLAPLQLRRPALAPGAAPPATKQLITAPVTRPVGGVGEIHKGPGVTPLRLPGDDSLAAPQVAGDPPPAIDGDVNGEEEDHEAPGGGALGGGMESLLTHCWSGGGVLWLGTSHGRLLCLPAVPPAPQTAAAAAAAVAARHSLVVVKVRPRAGDAPAAPASLPPGETSTGGMSTRAQRPGSAAFADRAAAAAATAAAAVAAAAAAAAAIETASRRRGAVLSLVHTGEHILAAMLGTGPGVGAGISTPRVTLEWIHPLPPTSPATESKKEPPLVAAGKGLVAAATVRHADHGNRPLSEPHATDLIGDPIEMLALPYDSTAASPAAGAGAAAAVVAALAAAGEPAGARCHLAFSGGISGGGNGHLAVGVSPPPPPTHPAAAAFAVVAAGDAPHVEPFPRALYTVSGAHGWAPQPAVGALGGPYQVASVAVLAQLPSGLMATGDAEGCLKLWHVGFEPPVTLAPADGGPESVASTAPPLGQQRLVGTRDMGVPLTAMCAMTCEPGGGPENAGCVAVGTAAGTLAVFGWDPRELLTSPPVAHVALYSRTTSVTALAACASRQWVAALSADGCVHFIDLSGIKGFQQRPPRLLGFYVVAGGGASLAWTPHSPHQLAVGTGAGDVMLLAVHEQIATSPLPGPGLELPDRSVRPRLAKDDRPEGAGAGPITSLIFAERPGDRAGDKSPPVVLIATAVKAGVPVIMRLRCKAFSEILTDTTVEARRAALAAGRPPPIREESLITDVVSPIPSLAPAVASALSFDGTLVGLACADGSAVIFRAADLYAGPHAHLHDVAPSSAGWGRRPCIAWAGAAPAVAPALGSSSTRERSASVAGGGPFLNASATSGAPYGVGPTRLVSAGPDGSIHVLGLGLTPTFHKPPQRAVYASAGTDRSGVSDGDAVVSNEASFRLPSSHAEATACVEVTPGDLGAALIAGLTDMAPHPAGDGDDVDDEAILAAAAVTHESAQSRLLPPPTSALDYAKGKSTTSQGDGGDTARTQVSPRPPGERSFGGGSSAILRSQGAAAADAERTALRAALVAVRASVASMVAKNSAAGEREALPAAELIVDISRVERGAAEADAAARAAATAIAEDIARMQLLHARVRDGCWEAQATQGLEVAPLDPSAPGAAAVANYPLRKGDAHRARLASIVGVLRAVERREWATRLAEVGAPAAAPTVDGDSGVNESFPTPYVVTLTEGLAASGVFARMRRAGVLDDATINALVGHLTTRPGAGAAVASGTAPAVGVESVKVAAEEDVDAGGESVRPGTGGKKKDDEAEDEDDPAGDGEDATASQECAAAYDALELYTDARRRSQATVLRGQALTLRAAFNVQVEAAAMRKIADLERLREKRDRVAAIAADISLEPPAPLPTLLPGEQPESFLDAMPDEIAVAKYVTAAERAAEAARRVAEAAARSAADVAAKQRALQEMMEGQLKRTTNSELAVLTQKEDWMDQPPEHLTEEQKRRLRERDARIKAYMEEKEKERKMLEGEMRQLRAEMDGVSRSFDAYLAALHARRLEVEKRLLVLELGSGLLGAAIDSLEEAERRERGALTELGDLQLAAAKQHKALEDLGREVTKRRERHDALAAEDRALDRGFRKEFVEAALPGGTFEPLLKMFRDRARPSDAGAPSSSNSKGVRDNSPGSTADVFGADAETEPDAETDYGAPPALFANADEDSSMSRPETLDLATWERFVSYRAAKVTKEGQLRAAAADLADWAQVYGVRAEEDALTRAHIDRLQLAAREAAGDARLRSFNMDLFLDLKQGLVEVDLADLGAGAFLPRGVVEDLNATVLQHGAEKVAILVELKDGRKESHVMMWELKQRDLAVADVGEKIKELQLLRVTQELRQTLRGEAGDPESRAAAEVEKLKHQSAQLEELNKANAEAVIHKLRVLRRASSAKGDTTKRLVSSVADLQKAVDERAMLMDMRANAAALATEPGEREVQLQTAMTNNQLRELTKLQANEIELLAAELDRLQRRSFPAFVVPPRIPLDAIESRASNLAATF